MSSINGVTIDVLRQRYGTAFNARQERLEVLDALMLRGDVVPSFLLHDEARARVELDRAIVNLLVMLTSDGHADVLI